MNPIISFDFLCGCLQHSDIDGDGSAWNTKRFKKTQLDWQRILRLADGHFVLPLLYHHLQQKGILASLPEDLQELLAEIHHLNTLRNTLILEEINRLAPLFNSEGIEPVFVKGSAALLMELYENRGLRVMNDVDFLVSREQRPICIKLMQSVGYSFMEGVRLPKDFHHDFPLIHDGHSIRFEIHDRLNRKPILDSTIIRRDSEAIDLPKGRVRVPAKTHFAIHNILHHQVFDHGFFEEKMPLYQIYDLYILRENHDAMLDWRAIGDLFTVHYLQDAYHSTLWFLQKLFHQMPPSEVNYLTLKMISLRCRWKTSTIINRRCSKSWQDRIYRIYNRCVRPGSNSF